MIATKTTIWEDLSSTQKEIHPYTDPIGSIYEHGWGGDKQKGYVELHPESNKTVQIEVDQKSRTIKIYGFWKKIENVAINSIELHF